jgi:hypothetical protein
MRVWAMRTGSTFTGSADDRQRLQAIVAAPTRPQRHVWRGQIELFSDEGASTSAIMTETGTSKACA